MEHRRFTRPSKKSQNLKIEVLQCRNTIKKQNKDKLVAAALRQQARMLIENPSLATLEEAQCLDRALRSCKAIGGSDIVWPRWVVYSERHGWNTEGELKFNPKWGYYYPEKL